MGKENAGETTTDLIKANQRIRELEREVKRLKEGNTVLKAAERFFSSKKKTSSPSKDRAVIDAQWQLCAVS